MIAYIVREHRQGRALAEVLDDPSVGRLFGRDRQRLLTNPRLIEALRRDLLDQLTGTLSGNGHDPAQAEPQAEQNARSIVEMIKGLAR